MVSLRCFHGTSLKNGNAIVNEQRFRPSDSKKLRMGIGAYFFCQGGDDDTYPMMCARELEKYHYAQGKHPDGYTILACTIECKDEEFLDLYTPDSMEFFHQMRYLLLNKSLAVDPNFMYQNAAASDTQVFNEIRKIRNLSIIRCPEFFGMFEMERKFQFPKGERAFPKTYVPNVIMACVNTERAIIKNIKIVERWSYYDGHEAIV